MYISGQSLIIILFVGLVAGWLAGKVVRGTGFGLVGDAAIGIVGALVGDWLLHRLGFHFWPGVIGLVIGIVFALVITRPLASEGFVLSIPVPSLVILLIAAGLAGLLAGMGPARRAARLDVLQALAAE